MKLQIKTLIDKDININAINTNGKTPLQELINKTTYSRNQTNYKNQILMLLLNCPRLKIPQSGPIRVDLIVFKLTIRDLKLLDAIDIALNKSWYNSPRCIFITSALTLGQASSLL